MRNAGAPRFSSVFKSGLGGAGLKVRQTNRSWPLGLGSGQAVQWVRPGRQWPSAQCCGSQGGAADRGFPGRCLARRPGWVSAGQEDWWSSVDTEGGGHCCVDSTGLEGRAWMMKATLLLTNRKPQTVEQLRAWQVGSRGSQDSPNEVPLPGVAESNRNRFAYNKFRGQRSETRFGPDLFSPKVLRGPSCPPPASGGSQTLQHPFYFCLHLHMPSPLCLSDFA